MTMQDNGTLVDPLPACANCKRRRVPEGSVFDTPDTLVCDAFPDGIPEAIWLGVHPHDEPFGGEVDPSLLFDPIDPEWGNPAKD
jgi:hypothetical protein